MHSAFTEWPASDTHYSRKNGRMNAQDKRVRLSVDEMRVICSLRGKDINSYKKADGTRNYRVKLTDKESAAIGRVRSKVPQKNGCTGPEIDLAELERLRGKEEEMNQVLEALKISGGVEIHEITPPPSDHGRQTIPIVQLSDWHVDEIVKKDSVLGLNEYNPDIAKERADSVIYQMCKIISHHQAKYNINSVVIALLGDFIGGWIHEELMQTNAEAPLSAIRTARNLLLSGLKYMHDNLKVEKIHVVCVGGNHSRTSRKIQYSNFSDVSLEYGMYLDLQEICGQMGLNKFEFIIPKAQLAVVSLLDKKILFAHGYEFKYQGGIGGIYPPMLRWFFKISKSLKVGKVFMGHWHQPIFTEQCVVNNSLKGYDAYAMDKGMDFQPPSQNLILLDSRYGFCMYQQVFPF